MQRREVVGNATQDMKFNPKGPRVIEGETGTVTVNVFILLAAVREICSRCESCITLVGLK